jgi:hypothetical protein
LPARATAEDSGPIHEHSLDFPSKVHFEISTVMHASREAVTSRLPLPAPRNPPSLRCFPFPIFRVGACHYSTPETAEVVEKSADFAGDFPLFVSSGTKLNVQGRKKIIGSGTSRFLPLL